jgi:hypothetical protein
MTWPKKEAPDPKLANALIEHGETLLKYFHEEYAKNATSPATEFERGKVAEWRQLLNLIYGENTTEEIVLSARNKTRLSVPPAGMLTDDGKGYMGFDSGCDMGYIGKIDPEQ